MAEIEHFVDPDDKTHPKFASIAHTELPLLSACNQMDGKPTVHMTIGEAVKTVRGVVHAYNTFMLQLCMSIVVFSSRCHWSVAYGTVMSGFVMLSNWISCGDLYSQVP